MSRQDHYRPSDPRAWAATYGAGLRTLLIATFSLLLVTGCSGNWRWSDTFGLHKSHSQTQETQDYIAQQARKYGLPKQHVSEARVGMSEVESQLDNARAAEVENEVIRRERIALVAANRKDAESREQITLAEIDRLKKEGVAKQEQIQAKLQARERTAQSQAEKNGRLRAALMKERMTDQADILSQGEQELAGAKARIEKQRVVRATVEKDGQAGMEQMRQNAETIRVRAAAMVTALRTEADASYEKMQAQQAEYSTQISSWMEQSRAQSNLMLARASATEEAAQATSNELDARAESVEQQLSHEQYDLLVVTAKSERQQSQAYNERNLANIKSEHERAVSDISRLRAEAQEIIENAQSESTQQFEELNSWFKESTANIAQEIRSRCDRLEKDARAEFVKAEAEARANAGRETAEHQETLSEAQMNTLIAEARADASNVRAEIMGELARKRKNNRVWFKGKTSDAGDLPVDLHDTPVAIGVSDVMPRVEPEHVADYRSALARVMYLRSQADARQRSLEATFNERKSNLEAVWAQKTAIGTEQLANAEAMREKADAQLASATADTVAGLALAKSKYGRMLVDATAFRKDAIAEVTDLRANSKATLDEALARAEALRKEADVVENNGQTEVVSLTAEMNAVATRGEVETTRLLVEADSVEQSEAALAAHVDSQIVAAERMLAAELNKLDTGINSDLLIANSNYEEALVRAEIVGRRTEVQIRRLQANDDLEQAIALAEIERLRDRLYVDNIKNEAQIERLTAATKAERAQFEALMDAEEVAIRTDAEITTAAVEAQRRIAVARERAIRSLFDARLAEARSNNVRGTTGDFMDYSFRRKNLTSALAESEAARAKSKQRLARLEKRQKALKRASEKDWDARLAKKRKSIRSTGS